MENFTWLLIALAVGFFAYLLYTRQMRWLAGVLRNIICGVGGLMLVNFAIPSIAVGVNAVTMIIVGVLGVPGFFLLYATRLLL
jgi:uncharacterized membrane protein YeaQ/YmgE (transglycosylase-associated protein family)